MSEFRGMKCDTCGKKHITGENGYPNGWVVIHPASDSEKPASIEFLREDARFDKERVVILIRSTFAAMDVL